MIRLFQIAFASVLLAGCNQPDYVAPRSVSMPPKRSDFPVTSSAPSTPSFVGVAAAVAQETTALDAIRAHVPQDVWPALSSALQTPGRAITATADPALSDLVRRYYEARSIRFAEQAREASVTVARGRGVNVSIALAKPPTGTVAAVLRRRLVFPTNVIVVGPDPTPETLAGALSALDQSRTRHGDALDTDQLIGLRDARVVTIDPAYRARLAALIEKLKRASPQVIDGVGTTKAIVLRTRPLNPSTPANPGQ